MLQRTLRPGFSYGAAPPTTRRSSASRCARVNGYLYQAMVPVHGHARRRWRRRGQARRARRSGASIGAARRAVWDARGRCPRSSGHLAPGRASTSRAPRAPTLVAHLDDTWARLQPRVGAALRDRPARLPGDQRVRRALPRPLPRQRPAGLLQAARGPAEHDRRGRPGAVAAQPPRAGDPTRSAACSRTPRPSERAGRARGERGGPGVPRRPARVPRPLRAPRGQVDASPRRAGPRTRRRHRDPARLRRAARTPTRPA